MPSEFDSNVGCMFKSNFAENYIYIRKQYLFWLTEIFYVFFNVIL